MTRQPAGLAGEERQGGLDPAQVRTLRAVIDCIHPADHLGPSGTSIGIDEHIQRALAGPLRRFLEIYREFLDALDELTQPLLGVPFVELGPNAQADQLRQLTTPEVALVQRNSVALDVAMSLVVEHTYEGLLGDPAYGGNRDGAGWLLVGYPGPRTLVSA
ncbi:MAG: gluconate 2-dehydrogenase subunit 3 family protein, partial [Marmoricola sp.]